MSKTEKAKKHKDDEQKRDTCFVIMPFGGYFDQYYKEIYAPAIQKCGLTPWRADDLFRSSHIVSDIWELTKTAKIVLADLSNKNPNVFYELGLAHAITKPTILLSQDISDVPFDLQGLRVIIYDKHRSNWGELLRKEIEKTIKATLQSPNQAIATPFIDIKGVKKMEATASDVQLLEMKKDIELLMRNVFPLRSPMTGSTSSYFNTLQKLYPNLFKMSSVEQAFCQAHGLTYPAGGECPACRMEDERIARREE